LHSSVPVANIDLIYIWENIYCEHIICGLRLELESVVL
jgi:hypothetical protein